MKAKDFEVIVGFGSKVMNRAVHANTVLDPILEDFNNGLSKLTDYYVSKGSHAYRRKNGFAELMKKYHRSRVLRVRKSKIHHLLNMPKISRQSGWINVEEELNLIAERRLHGQSVDG